MGSITLTKAKGIWQTLPAPLRGAVTLLAVLALAALLTTVRHNASAYLTGVWDTGSQTLVYGRIHQMEQGQHAPGGFLGVYTDDWSDDTNRALFRDDTPTDAAAFHPYTHQSGLQGWLFGRVNRLLRHRLPVFLDRHSRRAPRGRDRSGRYPACQKHRRRILGRPEGRSERCEVRQHKLRRCSCSASCRYGQHGNEPCHG